MKEVICPKCKTAFTIDEHNYASIVKQVEMRYLSQNSPVVLRRLMPTLRRRSRMSNFTVKRNVKVNWPSKELR